jgi:hypothetical protein
MAFWIYKRNSRRPDYAKDTRDWSDVFARPGPVP